MDKTAFLQACQTIMKDGRHQQGVGTLSEKTQHAVLKTYFDPCADHHEVKAGRFVADVRNEAGFVEIQTRQLFRLKKKLETFLEMAPVTVVYPVPAQRWLIWIDEDGTAEPRKKISRRPTASAILPELYGLRELLGQKGLKFCVLLLEVEDYRLKDGYGKDKKKRATRFDRFPVSLLEEIWLETPSDYGKLIPPALPEEFTAGEFAKAAKLKSGDASSSMLVLYGMGAVERIGKQGNAYLYRRAFSSDDLPDIVAGC